VAVAEKALASGNIVTSGGTTDRGDGDSGCGGGASARNEARCDSARRGSLLANPGPEYLGEND